MADFEIAFGETEINEGGYVNDPIDEGGETYRGVTRRFHPDWPGWSIVDKHKASSPDDFRTLLDNDQKLYELVKQVYRRDYWNPIRGDEIPNQHVANKVFDTGVNQGVARSVRYLQESLNLLNRNQNNYADIVVDGKLGDLTLATLKKFLQLEGDRPDYLLKSLAVMQGSFYVDILRRKPDQQKFARGWLNRVGLR